MIAKIKGKLVEKKDLSVIIDVQGLFYEIWVPLSVLKRLDDHVDQDRTIELLTYHYYQLTPSAGIPMLVGFLNEIEKDFFLQFIKVSGIGPRAAVKALNKSISEISRAIDQGDLTFLKGLPGIGLQRAKEIIAKLQGKVAKYGLIQDRDSLPLREQHGPDWQEEAMLVLLQLQYKRPEAMEMIQKALKRSDRIHSAEELLNEIYKQRVKT